MPTVGVLKLVYRVFPPSSNRIYFRGTRLTTKARVFAEDFAKFMFQNYGHLINGIDPQQLYAVHLHFYFETVVNESWNNPSVPPSKRAKERYKKVDLDNRIKLITDCVRDFIDVDDSHFFAGAHEKHMDPADPRIEIFVQSLRPEDFGVPPAQASLL
jgi:Holliday junction resolvase RusA-like endonuclease